MEAQRRRGNPEMGWEKIPLPELCALANKKGNIMQEGC
jgi:hypothetical protein